MATNNHEAQRAAQTLIGQIVAPLQKRVEKLERGVRTAQLGQSAIDNGSLVVKDANGQVRSVVGVQADGTVTHTDQNAPPPVAPTGPVVTPVIGGLTVSWDGRTSDGSGWLADYLYTEVHVSQTEGFTPDASTRIGALHGPGTYLAAPLTAGVTYYAKLVSLNTSGMASDVSPEQSGVPLATPGGGPSVAISQTAPASPEDGDLWFDSGNGYELNQWDGTDWLSYQFGTNAIATGSITAAQIAAQAITAANIQAGTITSDLIAAGAITATELSADAINGMTISAPFIEGGEISAADIIVAAGPNNSILVYTTAQGTTSQTFTASGTWVCPPGVTQLDRVVLTGAGGGGCSGVNGSSGVGGGGAGGGEVAVEVNVPVVPGTTYSFSIGAPGAGSASSSVSGANGGDTSITIGALTITAHGGQGGGQGGHAYNAGHGGTGSTNTYHWNGGDGGWTTGTGQPYMGGGGGGSSAADGSGGGTAGNGTASGGGAAGYDGAGSGTGGTGGYGAGNGGPGLTPGGGGAGGGATNGSYHGAGGDGGRGQLSITYTVTGAEVIGGSIAAAAGSDGSGNSYPAGIMGPVSAIDPVALNKPETWKKCTYGTGFSSPTNPSYPLYCKRLPDGRVHISGRIQGNVAFAAGQVLATLPSTAYAPKFRAEGLTCTWVGGGTSAEFYLEVETNGQIQNWHGSGVGAGAVIIDCTYPLDVPAS